jgi:hypothetical protein
MQNCNEKPTHAPTNAASIAKIWTATVTVRPSFRGGLQRGCARNRAIGEHTQSGSIQMTRLVIDLVLFSCMFAFVTGIVIAAANLLI